MPPLSYEKAILRSFVPIWRESLILYFQNGSLNKRKNGKIISLLDNYNRIESDFQNGLIVVSSGVDNNRLLFYLLLYIANPLHIYENDSLHLGGNLDDNEDSLDRTKPDSNDNCDESNIYGAHVDQEDYVERKVKKSKICHGFEVKREIKGGTPPKHGLKNNRRSSESSIVDDLYDCPSLLIKNSNLTIKSNSIYRKIFNLSEPPGKAKFYERSFLFSDVDIQSTVTMYSHLVFVLGFESSDFHNYESMYNYLTNKLFFDAGNGDEFYSIEELETCIVLPKLIYIDGTVMSPVRQQLYISGGYFCINSRILLNDILSSKILPEIIAGIVIMNAYQMVDDCNIAFVVRLLRMRNKVAFVKAITNNVRGFRGANLNLCLKNIFTKNLYIFPRCHQAIESVLNDTKIQPLTFEISPPLSDNAAAVYKSILKIIWNVVESMKRLKYNIDMNKVVYTSYSVLVKQLNKQINTSNAYQQPTSTTTNNKTTATSSSDFYIDTLLKFRKMLDNLLFMDPITFLEQLESIINDNSTWICTPNGIKMFKKSNERIFKAKDDKIELNVEKNFKFDYINKVLKSEVTNEQLVHMIKTNLKFKKFSKKKTKKTRYNFSLNRRRLVMTESRHMDYMNKYFKAGKKLKRNVLIIVENFYLVEYLTHCFKCDYHLIRILQYIQTNLVSESSPDDYGPTPSYSFINDYYSNINKKILDKKKLLNFYKTLINNNSTLISNITSTPKSDLNIINTENVLLNLDFNTPIMDNTCSSVDTLTIRSTGINPEDSITRYGTGDEDYNSQKHNEDEEKELFNYIDIKVKLDDYVTNDVYIIKSFSNINSGKIDKYDRLMSTLLDINPCIILIYSPNVHVFRTIENYCALKFRTREMYRKRMNFLQVHVLSYKNCLETHRFVKSLKSELDAWSSIQSEKNNLVIRLDEGLLLNKSTFIGQVIVDTRELNSKLPYYLFNLGFNIVPNVLEIGDYLITRDICIERKSFIDLQISLNNTRLSKQISEMCSAYNHPFLLIEFEDDDNFHLPATGPTRFGYNFVYLKLLVLCCNFPKLRLIWSSSPKQSANIIKYLKVNRTEPDLINNDYLIKKFRNKSEKLDSGPNPDPDANTDSMTTDTENVNDSINEENKIIGHKKPEFVKNRDALKILRNIPGVTTHNLTIILTKVKSLRHLSELNLKDLCNFLSEYEARLIHDYFNMNINV